MASLESLLRRSAYRRVTSYNPFSQPRYSGTYPLGPARRGFFLTTNSYPLPSLLLSKNLLSSPKSKLSLYQDRRLYHPLGDNRPMASKTESYPQLTERPSLSHPRISPRSPYNPIRKIERDLINTTTGEIASFGAYDPFKISWENPYKMIICLKRQMRREVMHALGMAGKSGFKKPKFTQHSFVRCF